MSLLLHRETETQAGFVAVDALRKPWVRDFMLYRGRTIPVIRTSLDAADRRGGIRARWDIGRMGYTVLPGLYALGSPSSDSTVFVTANYKMSFDALRSSLSGLDAWMVVLDTRGVNVWCAAGKGTFGTDELVSRVAKLRLADVVDHRALVLPQLGASGVSAPETARRSGFRVEWGPVRAADIPAWLAAGRRKDDAMRTVRFDLRDRMAVAPVELAHAWPLVPAALALAALYGLPADGAWASRALPAAILLLGAVPVGTLLFPALLPWLPGRAFVVKGACLGAAWAASCAVLSGMPALAAAGWSLVAMPVVAFLGMNFTGSSTYTSQPGAQLEVERSLLPMVLSMAAGLIAVVVSRLSGS